MSDASHIELSVKVKRGSRVVFDSTISIPVHEASRDAVGPVVDQWLGLMDAGLKLIHTTEEPNGLQQDR